MLSEYWEVADAIDCEHAEDFEQLREAALRILERMALEEKDIVMISGPITTGGYGFEKNMKVFSRAIRLLIEDGRRGGFLVFDQLPFQGAMSRIMKGKKLDAIDFKINEYPMTIIDDFYAYIIRAGRIRRMYSLPYSDESVGSLRERGLCLLASVKLVDYPRDLYRAVIGELIA